MNSASRAAAVILTAGLGVGSAGCQQMAALLAVAAGGDTTPAEVRLTDGPLVLLVDDPDQLGVVPDAIRALYDETKAELSSHDVNDRLIGWDAVQRLRESESDFDEMSIRKIGETLGAEQVIYLRVKYWATRETPTDPQFKGTWRVGMKIISTERKPDVRLWPKDATDRTIVVETDPELTDARSAETQVARTLGRKLARAVARHFYAHKPIEERDRDRALR